MSMKNMRTLYSRMRRQAQHCDSLSTGRRGWQQRRDDLHFPVGQIWPNGRYRRWCPAGSQTRRCRGQHTGGYGILARRGLGWSSQCAADGADEIETEGSYNIWRI
jgi:hypothetical protein